MTALQNRISLIATLVFFATHVYGKNEEASSLAFALSQVKDQNDVLVVLTREIERDISNELEGLDLQTAIVRKTIAIRLLGIRDLGPATEEERIGVLIRSLFFQDPHLTRGYPAGRALIDIGEAAVAPLWAFVVNADPEGGDPLESYRAISNAAYALQQILGLMRFDQELEARRSSLGETKYKTLFARDT